MKLRVIARILAAVLLLAGTLSGCSSGSQAVLDTALSLRRGAGVDEAKLDPRFRYLRVTIDGRTALLALGYVDPHPLGPVEVWYSAEREVIRLQNGRLAGASGLPTEWRRVALDAAPGWAAAVSASGALEWTRRRDVMPGYRYGVEDRLTLSRISPPEDSRFAGKGSRNLIWFEETLAPDARGEVALPPARYALDPRAAGDPVVYGEACLAKDLCFAWQRWPAEAPAGISAR